MYGLMIMMNYEHFPQKASALSNTEIYFSVTASTTHVISGEGKRTLNLLKGLMQVSQFFKLSIFSNV